MDEYFTVKIEQVTVNEGSWRISTWTKTIALCAPEMRMFVSLGYSEKLCAHFCVARKSYRRLLGTNQLVSLEACMRVHFRSSSML